MAAAGTQPVAEAILVLLRWLHALAAVAFLGWLLVYLLEPAPEGSVRPLSSSRFKEVTEVTLLVFLATGAVLSFDRLSRGAGTTYALLLGLKVIVSLLAYQFAVGWRRSGLSLGSPDGKRAAACGAAAVLLAAILKGVFENGLRGA